MNTTVFIVALLTLQGFCWWVGRRASRTIATSDDYYLNGRSVSFFPLLMTFVATQIGGGIVFGSSEEAYTWGWWVLLYPLGQVFGLLGLGLGMGRRLNRFPVSTVAQIFELAYGSRSLKRFASLLSIVSLFLILVAQVVASKKFLGAIGVDQSWLFFAFWGVLIAYTALGGMKAVIATDVIQALFFIVVFAAVFFVALAAGPGISSFAAEMPTGKLSGWLFMPFLFMFIEQDMGQRCFAAGSPSVLSRATIVSALIVFFACLIPIYFGMLGKEMGVAGPGAFFSTVILVAPSWLSALVGCAVVAAILSTADSLINSIGANLSGDFFESKGASLNRTRLLSIAIGVGAMVASPYFNNIVDLLIQSYELSAACLFVPLMGALFSKGRVPLAAGIGGVVAGAAGYLLLRSVETSMPKEVGVVVFSVIGYFSCLVMVRLRLVKNNVY